MGLDAIFLTVSPFIFCKIKWPKANFCYVKKLFLLVTEKICIDWKSGFCRFKQILICHCPVVPVGTLLLLTRP